MYKNLLNLFFFFFLLVFYIPLQAQTGSKFDQLHYVNAEWKNQADVNPVLHKQPASVLPEQQLVQLHLQETEKLLRNRTPKNLSVAQQQNRLKNLDVLHQYLETGVFPQNTQHSNRQPYFIDDYNTYCAVGYLMKMSGADAMAKTIHNTQNFNYLADIQHPDLMAWVANSGLTFDELALIQPSYGGEWPSTVVEMHYNNVGQDVNEFIEIHRGNGMFQIFPLTIVLFYDHTGNLYKTLPVGGMQLIGLVNTPTYYYYQFPTGESFADSGKIVLKYTGISGDRILSTIDYNSSGIRLEDPNSFNAPPVRQYAAKEDNTTPAGSSLTFCGLYYTNWTPSVLPNTSGTVNPCTVGSVPITLLSFNHQFQDKLIRLNWQTATEINNDYFELQRSSDGINFTTMSKIKGAGTSNSVNTYSYADITPNYINHYRLKQVDKDGKSSYSKILYVKFEKASPLIVIQNPVQQGLNLQINLVQANNGSLIIYDILGRVMIKQNAKSGSQQLDVSCLAAGKYLIRLETNSGQVYSQQFVKQ